MHPSIQMMPLNKLQKQLLLLLLSHIVSVHLILCRWVVLNDSEIKRDNFARAYSWKGLLSVKQRNFETSELMQNFVNHKQCHALYVHHNCFSHNPTRAEQLLRRKWVTNGSDSSFIDVSDTDPLDILLKLKNSNIVWLGDSLTVELFVSFVCHFNEFTQVDHKIVWFVTPHDKLVDEFRNQTGCPDHQMCHVLAAESNIPQYNITISYNQINTYGSGKAQAEISRAMNIKADPHRRTHAILNIGTHYSDWRKYLRDMSALHNDLQLWERQSSTITYWMESFPQHFTNGYYREAEDAGAYPLAEKTNYSLRCTPLQDYNRYKIDDFRNEALRLALPEHFQSNRIIKIAEPLYSQWDAHVDNGDSMWANRAQVLRRKDCTHYCLGSGVFRLALSEVISSLVRATKSQILGRRNKTSA